MTIINVLEGGTMIEAGPLREDQGTGPGQGSGLGEGTGSDPGPGTAIKLHMTNMLNALYLVGVPGQGVDIGCSPGVYQQRAMWTNAGPGHLHTRGRSRLY